MEKGTKITKSKWKRGMVLNLEAIEWDESENNLTPLELHFVFKGELQNVEISYWNGNPVVIDPTVPKDQMNRFVPIDTDLIKSMTLAKDWKPTPPPEPYIDPEDKRLGRKLGNAQIGHRAMYFHENVISIGCQDFDLKPMKALYKALVKVYGEPK